MAAVVKETEVTGNSNTSLSRTSTSTAASPGATEELKVEGAKDAAPSAPIPGEAPIELSRFRFWAIFMSLLLSVFLFALDQLIVATAIPKITVEFESLTQLPWLASGFFLPLFGLNLVYAQSLGIFPSKHIMMFAVVVFEIGSLICGVSPSMEVLILGRAIAGAGAAGIFSGALVIVAEITPLHSRSGYMAYVGMGFAVASVLGPLVGGAFSDHVSWRWCFYINLPLGGVALGCLLLFQPTRPPLGRNATYKGYSKEMFGQVLRLDWGGAIISMGWAVSLILALQYGGVTKKWNDGSVIACLVLTGVLIPVFLAWEWYIGSESQMFKFELMRSRTTAGASLVLFFLFAVFMFDVYYLSIGFQAIYHFSATDAGVRLLPLILLQVVTLMVAGKFIVPALRRYKWVIAAGPVLLILGSGLLYSVKYGTPVSHLYGFQIILGVGVGLSLQNAILAIQNSLNSTPRLVPAGVGLGTYLGFAGRIVGISLAGSVFENLLQKNLHKYVPDLPDELVQAVVNQATAVWTDVPEYFRPATLTAYVNTMRIVYIIGVPFGAAGLLAALFIKDEQLPSKEEEMAKNAARKEQAAREAKAVEGTDASAEADVEKSPKEKEV